MENQIQVMPNSYCSTLVEARLTDNSKGRGLFARERIEPGTTLVVWGGTVCDWEQVRNFSPEQVRLTVQIDDEMFLYSQQEGPGDWVNHSCSPNAGIRGQVTLVAIKRILPGEEICFDYAFTDSLPYDEFECNCGSLNCRGRVSASDWTLPDLQQRYRKHFSAYLLRRFRKLPLYQRPRRGNRAAALVSPQFAKRNGNGRAVGFERQGKDKLR